MSGEKTSSREVCRASGSEKVDVTRGKGGGEVKLFGVDLLFSYNWITVRS